MSARAVYSLDRPAADSRVIADSPHSGRVYPRDFGYACGLSDLRQAEDARLDELYAFLPDIGIAFLKARFPRSYIDLNRADTVTARHLAAPDGFYMPADSDMVRALCTPRLDTPIYDRPLRLKEVFRRVSRYWQPYHDRLANVMDETAARHGTAVHLDLHSMPSVFDKKGEYHNDYDIILGTRDGHAAATVFVDRLRLSCEAQGFVTGINAYGLKGREILRRTGNPAAHRHAIQVELNRKLYLDEATLALCPRFRETQGRLKKALTEFRAFCDAAPKP